MSHTIDFDAAATFIWRCARLIDRYRYLYLMGQGSAEQVLAALRPYQNPDGGFGQGLEPDLRAPVSQPVPVWTAFTILDEINRFDEPVVERACDYLLTITAPDGGVPFVLPSARDYPRAPWWEPEDEPQGSLNPTAGIVALLARHGVSHPWLAGAEEFC